MSLSRRATQLPLTAISLGLTAWERSRGLREFALRRGNEALQLAAVTPLGKLLPKQLLDDGADQEAARIAAEARETPLPAAPPAAKAPSKAEQRSTSRQSPTPPRRPAAPTRAAQRVGAPGTAAEQVEKITEQVQVDVPEHGDELPIPDFDNVSIGSLRARLRSLDVEQLVVLREWEKAHANRLQVVTTLDNRIAKVAKSGTLDYPEEARTAERAAEEQGGSTLRV